MGDAINTRLLPLNWIKKLQSPDTDIVFSNFRTAISEVCMYKLISGLFSLQDKIPKIEKTHIYKILGLISYY
jgi:hypothetical protein